MKNRYLDRDFKQIIRIVVQILSTFAVLIGLRSLLYHKFELSEITSNSISFFIASIMFMLTWFQGAKLMQKDEKIKKQKMEKLKKREDMETLTKILKRNKVPIVNIQEETGLSIEEIEKVK